MNIAVISLTENGRKMSLKLCELIEEHDIKRFCFYRHADSDSESFSDLSLLTADLFMKYDAFIYVCACGIAVRMISPHIVSKQTDPAVIVIDDCGKYVIPILSGHIGGANALSSHIAGLLGSQAVITTATDTGGRFSPDSFAVSNNLIITDFTAAKEIAAAVLSGEKIGLLSSYGCINIHDDFAENIQCRTGIYIGTESVSPFEVTLRLVPKNIVIGIGCKRGVPIEIIENAVVSALEQSGISIERVCAAATIDRKSDEMGLLEFCKKYDLSLYTFSPDELMKAEGDFSSSEFVKNITGVDNVCERSAVKCSGGKLILPKTALNGVTVALAEKPVEIDFGRKML